MPPVAYALSRAYEPVFEAASREIASLKRAEDPVVAVLPLRSNPLVHRVDRSGPEQVITVHPVGLRLRGHVRATVSACRLLHVFAPLPLPRRLMEPCGWAPSVLTAVTVGHLDAGQRQVLGMFEAVAVESERDAQRLLDAGVSADRLTTIFPATTVPPLARPAGNFTVTFASWPFETDEVHSRGLDALAAAARELPDVSFRVLTRPGSRVNPASLAFPANVHVDTAVYDDASDIWAAAHAVVAPFRAGNKCKSVPNSVVDAIGAGRPAVVGEGIGLATVLVEDGSGLVAKDEPGDLARQLRHLQHDYERFAQAARDRTRGRYDLAAFRAAYLQVYSSVLSRA